MTVPVAKFPDPTVRFAPAGNDGIDQLHQKFPIIIIRGVSASMPMPGQIQQFAIDIPLNLRLCGIAHSYRSDAAIAFQLFHGHFIQSPLTADPIENLKLVHASGGTAFNKPSKTIRLFGMLKLSKRTNGKGGIAHPGKAVIPVASPAGGFRQRSGRCGGNSAGGGMREALEYDGRSPSIQGHIVTAYGPGGSRRATMQWSRPIADSGFQDREHPAALHPRFPKFGK